MLFISLHGFDEEDPRRFYPSSGCRSNNTKQDNPIYPGGILNVPIHGKSKLSHNYKHCNYLLNISV